MAANNWTQLIKQIANEQNEQTKPCDFLFGTVEKTQPLEIRISQKVVLSKDFLILSKTVQDYEQETKIEIPTENGTYIINKIPIYNRLKIGEKVILLQKKGGQRFLVLDRVKGGMK